MKLITKFILCISLTGIIIPQNYQFSHSLGEFENASSFYITANGLIYISDSGTDEVVMLDTLGKTYGTFGGYGWNENSFDDPVDLYADPLSIYIADKNNHAIKRFDRNLNYISSLYKRESNNTNEQFGYPFSCATSNQGDLFLIDSENKRIMKFDIFGNFIASFGGMDAGIYQLNKPLQLALSSSNSVFTIDKNSLVCFDNYGNGFLKLDLSFKPKSIRILFDQMIICSSNEVYYRDLKTTDTKLIKLNLQDFKIDEIISAVLFNSKLYVLSEKNILAFVQIN